MLVVLTGTFADDGTVRWTAGSSVCSVNLMQRPLPLRLGVIVSSRCCRVMRKDIGRYLPDLAPGRSPPESWQKQVIVTL
jgi:hypothetical protein